MSKPDDLSYDVTSAISQGRRDYQEDAVIMDFPMGSEIGFAVLSDGMGGHAAGDIASKIVVTEVFSELKMQLSGGLANETALSGMLREAMRSANACLNAYASNYPEAAGMGATLVAPVVVGNRLYWISVGDSPLYLYRDGVLTQLNEDHSMGPRIDHLVDAGVISLEAARNHPDRNCLTSVLVGRPVRQIDCPDTPFELRQGDIVIVASDGLQFLDDQTIARELAGLEGRGSAEISAALMQALDRLDNPDQDNVAFCVLCAQDGAGAGSGRSAAPADRATLAVIPEIAGEDIVPHIAGPVMRRPAGSAGALGESEVEYMVGTMSDKRGSLTYCLSRTRRTA